MRRPSFDGLRQRVLNDRGDNRKSGITWGQRLGNPECPYMRRWVFNFGLGSIRVHHWSASDDPRHMHDHPWWFLTFVVRGGYTDVSTQGVPCLAPEDCPYDCEKKPCLERVETRRDHLRAPAVRFRPALHAHTVEIDEGGCWTVMLTGKHSRDWGFHTPMGWLRMRRFFKVYGHHPCD